MPRPDNDDGSTPGGDSFLDVIANMVGILIILVMVVGVRAGKSSFVRDAVPPEPKPIELDELEKRVVESRAEAVELKKEIDEVMSRAQSTFEDRALIDQQRLDLEILRQQAEEEIAQRRGQLDSGGQREFDVQRQISEAQIRLSELTQEQIRLVSLPMEVEEVESTPTPLATTVKDDAIYLRLKHGNAALVPVDELKDAVLRSDSREYLSGSLRNRDQAADLFGPIDGFRMRFRIERYAEVAPGAAQGRMAARVSQVVKAEVFPDIDDIGQPLEQALLPGSPLMRAVDRRSSNSTPLVAWVYPDSYDELRSLKKALWERDVPLAVWPLGENEQIRFSTNGTKASAQ